MSYEYIKGLSLGMGTEPDMNFATEEQEEETRLWELINSATGDSPSSGDLRDLPPELQEIGNGAPAEEKETWWTGDVEGMVSSFFDKVGIGEQAAQEAEGAAREAAGQTQGPTSISDVAPSDQAPRVEIEDTNPWYVQYAPHMIIGGLGFGAALLTLVVVMKKRD